MGVGRCTLDNGGGGGGGGGRGAALGEGMGGVRHLRGTGLLGGGR